MQNWLFFLLMLLTSSGLYCQDYYGKATAAWKKQDYDSASFYINNAIESFKKSNQTDSLVFASVYKAEMIWTVKGTPPALTLLNDIQKTANRLPAHSLARVALLDKKAQIHLHNAETTTAKKLFLQALESISPTAAPNDIYGNFYGHISWFYLQSGDFTPAMEYAIKARDIFEKLYGKDARQLLTAYQSMMYIAHDAGHYEEAEKYGLELQRLCNIHLHAFHPNRGLVHNDLGSLYETTHKLDEALFHRQKMVEIIQQDYAKHKNPQLLAIAYNNMGKLYQLMGELQLAEAYMEKAVSLHEINFGREGAGFVRPLVHLADVKRELGKLEDAEKLFLQAYQLQQRVDKNDWQEMAYIEAMYGDLFFDKKNYDGAEDYFKNAIQHYEKAGIKDVLTLEITKTTLGETYARTGRKNEALLLLNNVLDKYKKRYTRGNISIAGQYNRISETFLIHQQPETALAYSDSTFLELLQKKDLSKDGEWIKDLPYSHHIIRYLQNRTKVESALYKKSGSTDALKRVISLAGQYGDFFQRSLPAFRTQSTLMQLAEEHRSIFNTAINATWDLYQQTNENHYLEKAFEFAERSRALLLRLSANNILVDAGRTPSELYYERDISLRKRISELNAQYLDAGAKNDSLLTQLTSTIETYRVFQDSLIQSGNQSAKLRYSLEPVFIGDLQKRLQKSRQTLLQYVVDSNHIYAFVVSGKAFNVHKLTGNLSDNIQALRQLYNLPPQTFSANASQLYQQLLLPLKENITTQKLVIVPDGELFYLNFELLLPERKGNTFAAMHYLLYDYEISYQLSATNWFMAPGNRAREQKAMLLTPVFTDEMKAAWLKVVDSSITDNQYLHLLRQPFAANAAKQISRYIKNDLFSEQEADESVFKKSAAVYNILHLGTHAEVNNVAPLHSRFFLAKQLLPDSILQEDGYLHAYEIYGMQLQAELAVLTACETGTGQLNQGEGIMSLAHSFMYAGCPSVVMSLWKIDEKSSADIIATFYKYLAEGKAKSEALRQAKIEHIKESGNNAHPYFWAGMTLVGNEVAVYNPNSNWWWMVVGVVLLSGLWYSKKRKKRMKS